MIDVKKILTLLACCMCLAVPAEVLADFVGVVAENKIDGTTAEGQCIPNETAKLTASDGAANARFGSSVAMSADIAVIAAPGGCGSAYVFRFQNSQWTEEAKLVINGPPHATASEALLESAAM